MNNRRTLLDSCGRFHNYLRISLTERCNLRCQYCMPAEGIPLTAKQNLLRLDELQRLCQVFVRNGVEKVRFTGGEPTLRKDLTEIVRYTRSLGIDSIGLTSNGLTLSRHLPALIDAGLRQVNISLDTMHEEKFQFLTRMKGFKRVWDCISQAEELFVGGKMVKLNVVAMRGLNDDEIVDFVGLTRDRRLDVRFIEYMPFGGNKWERSKLISYFEMLDLIKSRYHIERLTDKANSTTKAYKIPGARGQFGFITSMTANFCSTCNRVRLTADGNLKVCLHDDREVSLRDAMRAGASDTELEALITAALKHKKPVHAGMDMLATLKNRPMTSIGLDLTSRYIGYCASDCDNSTTFGIPIPTATPMRGPRTLTELARRCLSTTRPVHASEHLHSGYLAYYAERLKQYVHPKEIKDRASTSRQTRDFLGIDLNNLLSTETALVEESKPKMSKNDSRQGISKETPASGAGGDGKNQITTGRPDIFGPTSFSSRPIDIMEPWPDETEAPKSAPPPPPVQPKQEKSLSHTKSSGSVHMVDVGPKATTERSATAVATVHLHPDVTEVLVNVKGTHKGNVLTTAELAGIMAAKQTSNLIPLCHNIPLTSIDVKTNFVPDENRIDIKSTVRCVSRTGVEMEALTAVSMAALTVYDMCKAVSHDMRIEGVCLLEKAGGKSDFGLDYQMD